MSRTQGRHDADVPYGDGHVFFSALDGTFTSGTGTATRGGSGLFSVNLAATATTILTIPLTGLLFRYGVQDYLQEQFGSSANSGAQGKPVGGFTALVTTSTTAGTNVSVPVNTSVGFSVGDYVLAGTQKTTIVTIADSTHLTLAAVTSTLAVNAVITQNTFSTPAGVTGPPPFTGVNQFNPVTAPRPKGIGIRAIYPVYTVTTAALSTNTIGITKTVFSPNAAPVVTNILADAANGLATAANAQPYITPINFASPISMQVTKYAQYSIEWDVTTAAGTAALYGVFLDLNFNFN